MKATAKQDDTNVTPAPIFNPNTNLGRLLSQVASLDENTPIKQNPTAVKTANQTPYTSI